MLAEIRGLLRQDLATVTQSMRRLQHGSLASLEFQATIGDMSGCLAA
jgi:hypothetical protein